MGWHFIWNNSEGAKTEKIQVVFKETGFNLTLSELEYFAKLITESQSRTNCCADCTAKSNCNRFLLQTPAKQIDLAVSINELEDIQDLVGGTIFKINLENYIQGDGRN